jgi:serine phosphatase RsbU (regulator of sigma subunit)
VSFRAKLILSLVALLIPLLAADVYFHYREYVRDQAGVLSEQAQIASAFVGDTDVFVARTVAVERSIGQALVKLSWPSSKAKHAYISSALDSIHTLRWMAFVDRTGVIVEASSPTVIGSNVSDRKYFRQLLAGDSWRVSDVLMTKGENQVGFIIATAVRDNTGKFLGVVTATVNEHRLLSAFRAQPSPQTELVLVDSLGRVSFLSDVPSLPYPQRDWSVYPFVRAALHGKPQYIESFRRPGRPEMMGAMLPVKALGWAAGAFVPRDQVLQPIRKSALRDLLVTLGVLGLTLILGSVLARQMIKPVESLSEAAEELGRGNLSTRANVSQTVEFATLATTMNRMAELIQQRDQALREAYEREKQISATLQKAMLPDVPERVGRLEIAIGYFPALKEAEVGGDFYDVMLLPNGLVGLVIADVSGKGLSAAVRTAMVRYMIEGFAHENPDPADTLRRVNASMYGYGQDWAFVTAFFGVIDSRSGDIMYANAGHPPPLLRRQDGNVERLGESAGLPLGVIGDAEYHTCELRLMDGDSLVCYTDGVIEARRGADWFGEERLIATLRVTDKTPNEMVDEVCSSVHDFAGGGQPSDDIALLVVKSRAPGSDC